MKKILLFALALSAACVARAQDPLFSQFYAAPLQLNPAFAGSAFAPRFGIAYRNQWPGFSQAYRTYAAFYEQRLENLNSGIGFHLESDNAGDGILRTNRFTAAYSYQVNITRTMGLKLGLEAGVHQTALDWNKLIFPDQLDPLGGNEGSSGENRPDQTTQTFLDLSSGILLYSDNFWIGGSIKHLNTPGSALLLLNENLNYGMPARFSVHGGGEINVKGSNKLLPGTFISPNFLYVSQGSFRQLNVGAYAGLGPVFGGAWFRHSFGNPDALIVLAGFREGIFKIGLTYDVTVSKLAGRSGGAYEMTVSVLLDKSERLQAKRRKARLNDCMGMFR